MTAECVVKVGQVWIDDLGRRGRVEKVERLTGLTVDWKVWRSVGDASESASASAMCGSSSWKRLA